MSRLLERLEPLSPRQRLRIAKDAGVSEQLIPKLLGGHRPNPRVGTIQPLLDYFAAVDRGEKQLPPATGERPSHDWGAVSDAGVMGEGPQSDKVPA